MDDMKALTNKVRETAYAIHVFHGNGYLEKVYENALVNRLKKAELLINFGSYKFEIQKYIHT